MVHRLYWMHYVLITVTVCECFSLPSFTGTKKTVEDYSSSYTSNRRDVNNHKLITRNVNSTARSFLALGTKATACLGSLCTGVEDYPYHEIKSVLKQKPGIEIYFDSGPVPVGMPIEIEDRFKEDLEGEQFCAAAPHTIYPEKGTNIKQTEKFIINVDGFKQVIKTETCINGTKCKHIHNMIPGYTTECVQRYVVKRLMAMNEDGNPAYDSFEVPSCCMCTLKKKDEK